jgi:hypothetical protein
VTNRTREGLLRLWPTDEKGNMKPMTAKNLIKALSKRPYNEKLKVLSWKIGESFVKVRNRPQDVYGKIYVERKR